MDAVSTNFSTVADHTAQESAPKVEVRLGDVMCQALIDTGSRVNLISRELYDVVRCQDSTAPSAVREPLQAVQGMLCSAGTEQLRLLGSVTLAIHLSQHVAFTAKFLVADKLLTDMIWGDQLLGAHQLDAVIDMGARTLHSKRLRHTTPISMRDEEPIPSSTLSRNPICGARPPAVDRHSMGQSIGCCTMREFMVVHAHARVRTSMRACWSETSCCPWA